jgi:hypothetical protein
VDDELCNFVSRIRQVVCQRIKGPLAERAARFPSHVSPLQLCIGTAVKHSVSGATAKAAKRARLHGEVCGSVR